MVNQLVYGELPENALEDHVLRTLERLKMQKQLFIKEIAHVTKVSTSELVSDQNKAIESSKEALLEQYDDALKNKDVDVYIDLLIKLEQKLYEEYTTFLFHNRPDEITKMILRHQSNDIKRDIHILKNLYKYG